MIFTLAAPWLLACRDPAPRPGTFVGNPELSARLSEPVSDADDGRAVRVIDGLLAAPEVFLGGCDQVGDVPLGARELAFDGASTVETLQIPTGTHCGVAFVVQSFTIRLDEGGGQEPTTVISDGFDLWVDTRFQAGEESLHTVLFGDQRWLADVAALAEPGENLLVDDDELSDVFYAGLLDGSRIDEGDGSPVVAGEPTRVDVSRWPDGPGGTPTSEAGCAAGTTHTLAVPVPPAAMLGAGWSDDVGWCVGDVQVAASLEPLLALQTDWRDGSDYEFWYNAWSQGCGALHCGELVDASGDRLGWPCTALALCEEGTGEITVTGFEW